MPDPLELAAKLQGVPGIGTAIGTGIQLLDPLVKSGAARVTGRKMPIPEPRLPIRPGVHPKVIPPAKPVVGPKQKPKPSVGRKEKEQPGPMDGARGGGKKKPGQKDENADPDDKRLVKFSTVRAALEAMPDGVGMGPLHVVRMGLLSQSNARQLETLAPLYPGQPTRYVSRRLTGTGYDGRFDKRPPPDVLKPSSSGESQSSLQ